MTVMNSPFGFREWVRSKASPYSIFAAKTSIESLIPALQKIFYIQHHDANVPRSGKLSDLKGIPVVKFKDNPWCVVYWSVGRSTLLSRDCCSLSERIQGQVLNLMEQATTDGTEWFLYDNGSDLESGRWVVGEESIYVESNFRKTPDFEEIDPSESSALIDRTIDELLTEQGVEIPRLDLDLSDPRIECVDLLVMPEFPLGMKEFQNWMYEGHPEYAIFAVKAPIDQVVQTLLDKSYVNDWEKQVETDVSIFDTLTGKFQYGLPIVQPKSNPWTVVYWHVGGWTDQAELCKFCSSSLNTKAIAFGEEDTSCAFGYEIYEAGQQIEGFEYCPGEELYFQSEIREEPEFDDFDTNEKDTMNGFINQMFIEEGIYIPNWDLPISDPNLERVDRVLRS
jgi:hypothetical protein